MKRAVVAVALAVVGTVSATLVRADPGGATDPAEGYPVDAVSARHHHPRGWRNAAVFHTIRTSSEWSSDQMPQLRMRLRLVGTEGRPIRSIWLTREQDGSYRGTVYSRDRFLGFVYGWRPNGSEIRVEFPRSLVRPADGYRWSAKLGQECDEEDGLCTIEWDRIPDEGTILHEL